MLPGSGTAERRAHVAEQDRGRVDRERHEEREFVMLARSRSRGKEERMEAAEARWPSTGRVRGCTGRELRERGGDASVDDPGRRHHHQEGGVCRGEESDDEMTVNAAGRGDRCDVGRRLSSEMLPPDDETAARETGYKGRRRWQARSSGGGGGLFGFLVFDSFTISSHPVGEEDECGSCRRPNQKGI